MRRGPTPRCRCWRRCRARTRGRCPARGSGAGAAAAIHQALVDLATQGSAIVLISQDLDELLALADRIAVINEGSLSRVLNVGEASIDEIGMLMGGVHGETDAQPIGQTVAGGDQSAA